MSFCEKLVTGWNSFHKNGTRVLVYDIGIYMYNIYFIFVGHLIFKFLFQLSSNKLKVPIFNILYLSICLPYLKVYLTYNINSIKITLQLC